MSTPTNPAAGSKTLAIRISPEIHAQLVFIAKLRERSINDEGIAAVLGHLEAARTDRDLLERAAAARQAAEDEARQRTEAIAKMFGDMPTLVTPETPEPPAPDPSPSSSPASPRSRRNTKATATDSADDSVDTA